MKENLRNILTDLMLIPGLSGHEDRVRRFIHRQFDNEPQLRISHDRLGNLTMTLMGDEQAPSVMLFTHMDELGFVVRKIEANGLIRIERVGGIPEKALPAQARDIYGVIASKSHHASTPEEKYQVTPYAQLFVDVGVTSREDVRALGIDIGTPIVYAPRVLPLGENRVAGTSIDDRAGCAVICQVVAEMVKLAASAHPTIHFVFSVQEEFNLRGAMVAARRLRPDIAIQLDLALNADTPDMAHRGEVVLGGGPAISLFSFHGRGTLNGTIPHPALPKLFDQVAHETKIPLQRTAHCGALTDSAYVQLIGEGVACIDVCFPCRYTHTALEMCDLDDLEGLARLLIAVLVRIDKNFHLDRDIYT